ncbi:DNA excision repair protein ERCC-4 [Rhizoctonia solani]|uniref:DNA excision repair protein ERCC-4 n=1 Tax=Rhizoctonia solani TaxID=456999 RepID=A0A8H8PCM4_9AGAM|nr:DNA excision repair protein ERCC-4 [Rhizoctonia solani]QRW27332.1 DNA excision repair protein ERCC-4 [Rhizoctonia solani]
MTQEESPEIIDISDYEDDTRPDRHQPQFAIQTSLANSESGQYPSQPLDILVIDSSDSEDLEELEERLKYIVLKKKTKSEIPGFRSSSNPTPSRHTQSPFEPDFEDDILVISSSEEDTMILQPAFPNDAQVSNNPPKHHENLERDHILKQAPEASFRKPLQKERTNGVPEQVGKDQGRLHREVNKLVTDKKSTLKYFTVEISHTLEDHPRQHVAKYDNKSKEWVPVTPYHALEDLYVLFLSADSLALAVLEETLTETLSELRSTHQLTAHSQIFVMIDGLHAYYKRKGGRSKRNAIESALATLQASERCFIVQVEGASDAAQWLFNIIGDLGIRPYKRIRESFLPFCTDMHVRCGGSKADTYKKMLQQIRYITESAAGGIIEEAPTLRELFEGYAQEPDIHARHERFKDITILNRKDGVAKSRILNRALSKKVHDVFWGEDPLTLVV